MRIRLISTDYIIEDRLLSRAAPLVRKVCGADSLLIVSDPGVRRVADRLGRVLQRAGLPCRRTIHLPKGITKDLEGARSLYDAFQDRGLERPDHVIIVGGGLVGDLVGFAASTYQRGVASILVPTTLLAQVDAAIGGKTGLDHGGIRNSLGTFHSPRLVLIDPTLLASLPERHFRSGLAEVVKYAVIGDARLFQLLESHPERLCSRLTDIVARCVRQKVGCVRKDYLEAGPREVLNFGHTVGHALESSLRDTLTHGEAVALGMLAETRMAVALGMALQDLPVRLGALLTGLGLPTRLAVLPSRPALRRALASDKKSRKGLPRFVLPIAIGKVRRGILVPEKIISSCLESLTTGHSGM